VNLASMELLCVAGFEWDGFGFGGTDERLVQMAFWGLYRFGIVLLDVASSGKWPADEVPRLHSFEPSSFDRIATDCMHPFNGLFGRGEVVNTVGSTKGMACF